VPSSATITIYGTGATVTNITSSNSHLSVQYKQAIKDTNNNLKVEYTCSVDPVAAGKQAGYSLSDTTITSILDTNTLVLNGTWNQKITVTYKFFD
jgi:hypothetical protein